MILAPSQKLANNVGNLGKIIVATRFEWSPKVQKIPQSCYTGHNVFKKIHTSELTFYYYVLCHEPKTLPLTMVFNNVTWTKTVPTYF